MAEIKSSGSAAVSVSNDATIGVFGPWTALFMGVDQASHPITFDSSWALLVVGIKGITGSQFAGLRYEIEIGIGPTSPPAKTVWGPMRYTTWHTGGGRGMHTNYSFPLIQSAGDQFWMRIRKPTQATVDPLTVFLTVWDGIQPIRPATVHLSTTTLANFPGGFISAPITPTGVLFGISNVLGLWYEMTTPNQGLGFDATWLSIVVELLGIGTTESRWQLGADQPGQPGPPDLPELIDIGFQSSGQGGGNVSEMGDVMNFPIPWKKGESVWIRGAGITSDPRTYQITATFWGNP